MFARVALALSLNEKGKSIMISLITLFIFKVPQYSSKIEMCKFVSLEGETGNWCYCVIGSKEGFNSKL
jgi:hypothetical protein